MNTATAPKSARVSITTPSGLIQELFTHGGSGTLVRMGEMIKLVTDKTELDRERTEALVENAFGRKLKNNWWDGLDLHQVYMSASYRAGAILTRIDDFIYLDKFAVVEDARGEGLSRTVWRGFVKDNPAFFWRSRTTNGFNAFYHDSADGSVKAGPWTVFWKGEKDWARISRIAEHVAAMPASFVGDDAS